MIKKIILLAVFLPACSVFAGDLSVDNLSVQQDASFYGAMHAYVPGGDVAMGSFTNQYGYGAGTNLPVLLPGANPIGAIQMFAATNAPSGWLLCNGSAVSRTTYSNLFSVIGTTYGTGDGSTTFNVPDMRQRFAFGANNSLGTTGGAQTVTLTVDQMPAHTHGTHAWGADGDWGGPYLSGVNLNSTYNFNFNSSILSTGGGQSHSNMPPYVTVNFIIYAGQ